MCRTLCFNFKLEYSLTHLWISINFYFYIKFKNALNFIFISHFKIVMELIFNNYLTQYEHNLNYVQGVEHELLLSFIHFEIIWEPVEDPQLVVGVAIGHIICLFNFLFLFFEILFFFVFLFFLIFK